MVVLILEKEVLVNAVNSKGDGGGAKAGKSALEAFGAGEFAGRTPGLAVFGVLVLVIRASSNFVETGLYSLLLPGIVLGHSGSSTVLADVEPRGVGLGDGPEDPFSLSLLGIAKLVYL